MNHHRSTRRSFLRTMYYTHPCGIAWSENLIDWVPTGKAVWPGGGREAGAIALLRDEGILLMTQGGHPTGRGSPVCQPRSAGRQGRQPNRCYRTDAANRSRWSLTL